MYMHKGKQVNTITPQLLPVTWSIYNDINIDDLLQAVALNVLHKYKVLVFTENALKKPIRQGCTESEKNGLN